MMSSLTIILILLMDNHFLDNKIVTHNSNVISLCLLTFYKWCHSKITSTH